MPTKKAKNKDTRKQKKQAKGIPSETFDEKVQWCFELFDNYIWHGNDYQERTFRSVADGLKQYSNRTWKDINSNRSRDHYVAKDKLSHDAQRRLKKLKMDDIDNLWRFRFGGALRIWGIKAGKVFRVLWWDPQHKICPSEQ